MQGSGFAVRSPQARKQREQIDGEHGRAQSKPSRAAGPAGGNGPQKRATLTANAAARAYVPRQVRQSAPVRKLAAAKAIDAQMPAAAAHWSPAAAAASDWPRKRRATQRSERNKQVRPHTRPQPATGNPVQAWIRAAKAESHTRSQLIVSLTEQTAVPPERTTKSSIHWNNASIDAATLRTTTPTGPAGEAEEADIFSSTERTLRGPGAPLI